MFGQLRIRSQNKQQQQQLKTTRTMKTTVKKATATDKELALQMQTGTKAEKQNAYTELYKRFRDKIYITFFRALNVLEKEETAKDLSQNTFLKVFNNINSYNPESSAFSTWIYTIAHNELIDYKRKQKFEIIHFEGVKVNSSSGDEKVDLQVQIVCKEKTPIEQIMVAQKAEAVQSAITKCLKNEQMRNMVVMRFYEDMSHEEISQRLDVPIGTIKSTLSRARDLMKDYIEKNCSSVIS